MYYSTDDTSFSNHWIEDEDAVGNSMRETWYESEMEEVYFTDEIVLLLDLDEGTLSVYKNGLSLGVMKRGLIGHYCWVISSKASATLTSQVTIKRGKGSRHFGESSIK